MVSRLRLSVSAYEGPDSWRWMLRDQKGNFLGDHEVNLSAADWQRAALPDLRDYLAANSGGRGDEEARIVAEVGEWIGDCILGPLGPVILGASPADVIVSVPASADELALIPLESARVGGQLLSIRGVTLVSAPPEAPAADGPPDAIKDKLRVLAIFPSHPGDPGLNQRKERRALDDMMKKICATWNKAVEFRALQYGFTYQDLRDTLEDDPGWDVVHVSGYAAPGLLRLERDHRRLGGAEPEALAGILDLIRGRLKLVTASACVSSAAIAARDMKISSAPAPGGPPPAGEEWPGEGLLQVRDLAERLGCAVLTVRFPVPDDFAFFYFRELYRLLIAKQQPLARAAGIALSDCHDQAPMLGFPALSLVAPVLFGAHAADLRLAAPSGVLQGFSTDNLKLSGFEIPPSDLFVGRDDVMREASGALAYGSGRSGVLLYGMPGAGKTACAVELAYTRDSLDFENTFPVMIWYQVTSDPENIRTALRQFAKVLDSELGDFPLSGVLDDDEALRAQLPKMREYFKRKRILVVLDNVETLLEQAGGWRDERWGLVIGALTSHDGFARVLITTRQLPAVLDQRVLTLLIGPLDRDDAVLLARDLEPLRALLDGQVPGMTADEARNLGLRVLTATRGHPKLLGLANAAVGDRVQLEQLLDAAAAVWLPAAGTALGAGAGPGKGAEYVQVLESWTATIVSSLTAEARAFFQVLSCMDEGDRVTPVIADVWAGLSAALVPAAGPLPLNELIALLRERGLVTTEAGLQSAAFPVLVHPVLAEQGRRDVDPASRLVIDAQLAEYWVRRMLAGDASASLSASSYLSRLDERGNAQQVLDRVFSADRPPSETGVLIAIERVLLHRAYEAADISRIAARQRLLSAHLARAGDHRQALLHLLAAGLLDPGRAAAGQDTDALAALHKSCGGTIPDRITQLSAELGAEGADLSAVIIEFPGGLDQAEHILRDLVAGVRAMLDPEGGMADS